MPRWLLVAAIVMVPLAYIASESGWLVAEFGRQPWTIQDMLPTWASVSDLHSSSVMLTFFLFLVLFTTMLAVEINIMQWNSKEKPAFSLLFHCMGVRAESRDEMWMRRSRFSSD